MYETNNLRKQTNKKTNTTPRGCVCPLQQSAFLSCLPSHRQDNAARGLASVAQRTRRQHECENAYGNKYTTVFQQIESVGCAAGVATHCPSPLWGDSRNRSRLGLLPGEKLSDFRKCRALSPADPVACAHHDDSFARDWLHNGTYFAAAIEFYVARAVIAIFVSFSSVIFYLSSHAAYTQQQNPRATHCFSRAPTQSASELASRGR